MIRGKDQALGYNALLGAVRVRKGILDTVLESSILKTC